MKICLSYYSAHFVVGLRGLYSARAKGEERKVDGIIEKLFRYYAEDPSRMPESYAAIALLEGTERAACDYISGMTDSYAIEKYGEIFIPFAWTVK